MIILKVSVDDVGSSGEEDLNTALQHIAADSGTGAEVESHLQPLPQARLSLSSTGGVSM